MQPHLLLQFTKQILLAKGLCELGRWRLTIDRRDVRSQVVFVSYEFRFPGHLKLDSVVTTLLGIYIKVQLFH